jgi:hypothetical protein
MEDLKRIPVKLEVKSFIITFEYETWKGHHRKIDKRTVKHIDLDLAKKEFKKAADKFRTAFNVSILSVEENKDSSEIIEL